MVEGMRVRAISRITGVDISNSHVEGAKLSLRLQLRTLRVTPAMEAAITDHVWPIQELLGFGPEQARAA